MVFFVCGVVGFDFCVVCVGVLWLSAAVLLTDLHGLLLFAMRLVCVVYAVFALMWGMVWQLLVLVHIL